MKDGGSAFPQHGWTKDVEVLKRMQENGGMTLRDYFAAKALPFCLEEFGGNADDATQYAEAAYQIADAMLAAREVQQ